jgi:hypothetical protein
LRAIPKPPSMAFPTLPSPPMATSSFPTAM